MCRHQLKTYLKGAEVSDTRLPKPAFIEALDIEVWWSNIGRKIVQTPFSFTSFDDKL